jgi:ferredoxin
MYEIEIGRSLRRGFGLCAEPAPEGIELDGDGLASVRIGSTTDPVVLGAATGCPIAAITIHEEEAA